MAANKTVIITGASGNLGKAAVSKFLGEGYRVIATVSPGKQLDYTPAGEVDVFQVDLTNEESATSFVATVIEKYNTINVALLLVGGFSAGDIFKTDGAALRKMYSLNFESAYFTTRPVFQQMVKQHAGRIVLIGARPALKPEEGKNVLAYTLSKSMLFRLAECLNVEGADKNVVVSVVAPGVIDTPSNRSYAKDADTSRWVKPEEIADVIANLVSENNRSMVEPVVKLFGNA
jgi:NAD(P)-dependent dehydrogenase (short-subunit alcohol dehydrogenase family)